MWLLRVFTNNPSYLAYVTERNLVNSRLINYVPKNTRASGSYEQNTRPSHHARMRIMHKATENMWFLWRVRKPLFWSRLFSIITVISSQLKKER